LVIANNVVREVIRDRILYFVFFFTLFLWGANQVLAQIATITANKIFLDVGLATIAIPGLVVTLFLGTGLINKEIEKRTIMVLLAKPVSRVELILGKHLGLTAVTGLLVGVLTLIYIVILELYKIPYPLGPILLTNLFLSLELSLLTALAILFSIASSSLFAILFTSAVYLTGHLSPDLVKLVSLTNNANLQDLARKLYLVLPDLSRLNLRNDAVYSTLPDPTTLALHAGYGILYTVLVLVLAILIFLRREF
jgi:ABC-type transport system involved in multi-copper enzyme maturation permease subunit